MLQGSSGTQEAKEWANAGDLKSEFISIVNGGISSSGLISTRSAYKEAPPPLLSVEGIGLLGLPMSNDDAAALQSVLVEERAGASRESEFPSLMFPDHHTRSSTEFFFQNKAWIDFLAHVSRGLCVQLGIDYEATPPHLGPKSIALGTLGSWSAIANRKHHAPPRSLLLARVLLVLPSSFTGGALKITYDDYTDTYALDANASDVVALAWRPEATAMAEPIVTGVCLTLCCDLILPDAPEASRQRLLPPLQLDVVARLRNLFHMWGACRRSKVPSKLVCGLQGNYSITTVKKAALKGPDLRLVALVDVVAQEYGLRTGLAVLNTTKLDLGPMIHPLSVDPEAVDLHDAPSPPYARGSESNSETDSDSDVNSFPRKLKEYLKELEKPSLPQISQLVGLDGTPIQDALDCTGHTEAVPRQLERALTSSYPWKGFDASSWQRQLVLVIWPRWAEYDRVHGQQAVSEACTQLQSSTSERPTEAEENLLDVIFGRASSSHSAEVVAAVCPATIAWGRPDLWVRAMTACDAQRSVETLDVENVRHAIERFGFTDVKSSVESVVQREPSDVTVFRFLHGLERWMATQAQSQNCQLPASFDDWVQVQRSKRYQTVKSRLDTLVNRPDEANPVMVSLIVHAAIEGGNTDLIFLDLVPRLSEAKVGSEMLRALVNELRQLDARDGRRWRTQVRNAIPPLVRRFASCIDLSGGPDQILNALQYCLCTQVPDACAVLLDRLFNPMGRLVDAEYVEETIAIVLTRLPNLLRLHDHCPTSPPFVSRLQSILVYWIKEVMIPMPTGSQEVLDQLQPLDAWTCACEHCVSVRAFLQEEPEGEMTWYKIGAPTVKHLTKFLKAHAGGIAAWSTVRSCSPQGIEVTKQPAFVNPVRWASYRARGVRLLQSIGANVAVDVLRDVLGQYLPLVAAALSGRAEPYDAVLEAENVLRGLLAQIRGETETLRDIRTRSPCCAAAEAATLATDAIADEEADPTVVEPLVAGALKRPRSPSPFPASLDSTLSGILWRQNHIEDGRAAQRIKREDPEPIELGVKAEDN